MRQEFGHFPHVVGHAIHPVAFYKTFIVVGTMAGCGMNKARARIISHVIAINHWHVIGPEIIHFGKRVRANGIRQLIVGDICHTGELRHA